VRARWLVVVTVLFGCFHFPDEAMLLAFSRQPGTVLFDNPQPKYLGFDDERAAFIFEKLTDGGTYEAAPDEGSLICPGIPVDGMHGYVLGVHVDSVMRDSAIVIVRRTCTRQPRQPPNDATASLSVSSGISVTTTNYLLVRRNGLWTVEKALVSNSM
jgi:hypothetical protein